QRLGIARQRLGSPPRQGNGFQATERGLAVMRISVFGLGYVGCVSAACFADAGFDVIGVELNEDKVDMINAGRSPIVEPGLEDLLKKVVSAGKLRATTSCEEAVQAS